MRAINVLAAGLLALASAVPAAAVAAPATPGDGAQLDARQVRLDRSFMIGVWTDNEDCEQAVDFRGDGTFSTLGGASGIWFLEGDELTLTSENILTVQIVPIDHDTIGIVNPDGSLGRSTRCDVATELLLPALDETV